jgi:RNA polymerase sigma factor (TIGR02999 family)
MPNGLNEVLARIRRALPQAGPTDGDLLARFVAAGDEEAFAALLGRHGPLVLSVCRRLARHEQDAEDAFQATFLVLAQKAGSVARRDSVASWLYGVAYRTALRAREAAAKRRSRERQLEELPHPAVLPEEPHDWLALYAALDKDSRPRWGAMRGRSDAAFTLLVSPMSEVTRILSAIENGDPRAAEQLLPLVYEELRKLAAEKLAQEKPGQTLQATALVHEAYLRLVDVERAQLWNSRGHFFTAAAEAMRRILLDRVRDKRRLKRGGDWRRLRLDRIDFPVEEPPDDLLALDEALRKLAQEDPLCADLVKLRFFTGLTLAQAASTLGIARRSADRYWAFARSWLYAELRQGDEATEG